MAESTLKRIPIVQTAEVIDIPLAELTWSGSNKYYNSTIWNATGKTVVGITLKGFADIIASEIVQPFITNNGNNVGLMSNTKTFSKDTARVGLRIAYIQN